MNQQGGAIFLAVGQNLFSTQLVERLSGIAGLDTKAIINTVVSAYSYSLTRVFILSAALSACVMIGSLMVKWVSIKKDAPNPEKAVSQDVEAGIDAKSER